MEMWSKLGGMTPVCEGVGSYFVLEQSLVIRLCGPVHWPHCVTNLDRIVGMLVVSLPLEALHISAFSNLAATGIW